MTDADIHLIAADDQPLTPEEQRMITLCSELQRRRLRGVVVAVAIALAISLGGSTLGWFLLGEESKNRAAQVNAEGIKRAKAINDSRRQNQFDNCLDTDARNRAFFAQLARLTPKHPSAAERRRAEATKILVAAVVPYVGDPRLTGLARIRSERLACQIFAEQRVTTDGG